VLKNSVVRAGHAAALDQARGEMDSVLTVLIVG